jgi:hypothetical protein
MSNQPSIQVMQNTSANATTISAKYFIIFHSFLFFYNYYTIIS